jgi:hypothetical protein
MLFAPQYQGAGMTAKILARLNGKPGILGNGGHASRLADADFIYGGTAGIQ